MEHKPEQNSHWFRRDPTRAILFLNGTAVFVF